MKKWFLILAAVMLLVTGCSSKNNAPALPGDTYDTGGERLILFHGRRDIPISFTKDGVQQIENGTYWYYELSPLCEKTGQDPFYLYDAQTLELTGKKSYSRLGRKSCWAVNGDWPLFLNPVHTEYAASAAEQVPQALTNAAAAVLKEQGMGEAPVQVREEWVCDLDGDGATERLFSAALQPGANAESPQPAYSFLCFMKGDQCQLLEGTFLPGGGSVPVRKPLVCDLNGSGAWSLIVQCEGDYNTLSVLRLENGAFTPAYQIIY